MFFTKLFARLTLTTVLAAPMFACGGADLPQADESSEEAATYTAVGSTPVAQPTDPCKSQAADVTVHVQGIDPDYSAASANTAYATRSGCNRFIVDFVVHPSADGGSNHSEDFLADGGLTNFNGWFGLSESACEATRLSIRRYRKTPSGSLTLQSTAIFDGSYSPPQDNQSFAICSPVLVSGDVANWFEPNAAGNETHRIAARVTRGDTPQRASASLRFQYLVQ